MANGAYIFYSLTFTLFILFTGELEHTPSPSALNESQPNSHLPHSALYLTRNRWLPYLPVPWDYIYTRLPSTPNPGSFTADIEDGFTSADFDLATHNVGSGDSRGGLDAAAKREIGKIMRSRRVGFDEARRVYTEARFQKNGIGPDGRPRDPKFVSFS